MFYITRAKSGCISRTKLRFNVAAVRCGTLSACLLLAACVRVRVSFVRTRIARVHVRVCVNIAHHMRRRTLAVVSIHPIVWLSSGVHTKSGSHNNDTLLFPCTYARAWFTFTHIQKYHRLFVRSSLCFSPSFHLLCVRVCARGFVL